MPTRNTPVQDELRHKNLRVLRLPCLVMLAAFGMCGPAHGQNPVIVCPAALHQPMLLWTPQTQVVGDLSSKTFVISARGERAPRSIPCPDNTLGMAAWEGGLGALQLREDQFVFLFHPLNGQQWESYPVETTQDAQKSGAPFFLSGTDDSDLFLGVNTITGFTKDDEASICAWWKRDEHGRIHLDAVIPLELEEPLFRPQLHSGPSSRATFRMAQVNPSFAGLYPFLDHAIRVPGAHVIVSWATGTLWVIKDHFSTPSRIIRLATPSARQLHGSEPFPAILLGLQPTPSGTLIAAAREEAVLDEAPRQTEGPSSDPPEPWPTRRQRPLQYPKVRWLEIDPRSGSMSEVPEEVLAGAPMTLANEAELRRFRFTLDPKGHVQMAPLKAPATPRPAATAAGEAPGK